MEFGRVRPARIGFDRHADWDRIDGRLQYMPGVRVLAVKSGIHDLPSDRLDQTPGLDRITGIPLLVPSVIVPALEPLDFDVGGIQFHRGELLHPLLDVGPV